MEKKETPNRKSNTDASKETEVLSTPPEQRTPVRVGKSAKRKIQSESPSTPTGISLEEFEKSNSTKKQQRKGTPGRLKRLCSPTSLFKPPLTERQQLALLMHMSDASRHTGSGEESSPRSSSEAIRGRIQRRNERGETPLHVACIKGDLKQVTALVGQGAEINATDNACWTPLHEACNHGHVQVVIYLLEKGANVNAEGMGGDTPLHDAVLNQHTEVIQALLNHGADPSKCNEDGKRPLDVCKEASIASLLEAVVQNDALCADSKADKGDEERQPAATEGSPADWCPSSSANQDGGEVLPSTSWRVKEGEEETRSVEEGEGVPVLSASSKGKEEGEVSIISGVKEEGEVPTSSMIKEEEKKDVMLSVPTSSSHKEEDVMSGVPTSSSHKKEDEMSGVFTSSSGKDEADVMLAGVPTSSSGKDEEDVMLAGVPTSSSGKDEEERMEVSFEASNNEEEEEEESALPSSSVEEEGGAMLLPLPSGDLEGVEEKEGDSVFGAIPTSTKEEAYPSSSSKEEAEEMVSVLSGTQGKMSPLSCEVVPVSQTTSTHTLTLPLGGIGAEAASSELFVEVEEEPSSSTMADQGTLSVNRNIWATKQEKEEEEGRGEEEGEIEEGEKTEDPSSTVSGPKETTPMSPQTTADATEDGCLTYAKKDVKEEFYSDISSTEDEVDYFEQQLMTQGGKKRTRLHSRGSKDSASRAPGGTEQPVRDTRGNPAGSVSHTYPRRTTASKPGRAGCERDRGDRSASVATVLGKPEPAVVAVVRQDGSVASGEMNGGAAYPGEAQEDVVGTSSNAGGGELGTVGTSSDAGGGETGTVGTSRGGPLCLADRVNVTSVQQDGETTPIESAPEGQLVLPPGPAQEDMIHTTSGGMLLEATGARYVAVCRVPSEVEGEATLGVDEETLHSGPPPSSLSSPHGEVPVTLAPPPLSPSDAQLKLCVSFPLSLLNLCRDRLHHQGGEHGKSVPESLEDHSNLVPTEQQEYVAMETLDTMGGDDQDPGGKEPRFHPHHHTSRHSRKPQQVFSSKRLFRGEPQVDAPSSSGLECTEVMGVVESSDGRGEEAATFSVRAGWGLLPPPAKKGKSQRDSPAPASQPTHVGQGKRKKGAEVGRGKGGCEEEEEEESAVVSLVASLPLSIVTRTGAVGPMGHAGGNVVGSRSPLVCAETLKPSGSHRRTGSGQLNLVAGNGSGQLNLATSTKDPPSKDHELEDLVLPPKKRCHGRLVHRSIVVQRRRERREPTPVLPANFRSFLLTSQQYRSKQLPQPTNPKTIYPPIHTSMYKLFNEHETERLRLLSAHATELDRLVISFEEELVRAHQKAAAKKNQPPPLSVCSFLLERMMPHMDMDDSRLGTREEGLTEDGQEAVSRCPPSKEDSSRGLDPRLLASFVQDVWDKYLELRTCVLARQGHESEALWLLQLEQWKDRLQELGFSAAASREVLLAHVPMVTSINASSED